MTNNSPFSTTQLKKGIIEILLLLIVQFNESYGYQIVQKLKSNSLEVNEGTIYPILRRLEANNFVSSKWVQPDSGNPRKYYKTTQLGKQMLKTALTELENINQTISDLKEQNNE